LLAVAEHESIESDLIPRLATGFCSGVARTGGTCGAVAGGIIALGLIMGRDVPGQSNEACYEAVRSLLDQFTGQFGSINCQELTGVRLGTAEGQLQFKAKGQMTECARYVGEATRLVIDIACKNRPIDGI
jgi:C_GCAxxG_C_C family probable redox protein